DGETPATWATCSSVTGPFAIKIPVGKNCKNSLAQSIVHCHNNRRQAKNQQSRCMRPAKKFIGRLAPSDIQVVRGALFTRLNQRHLSAAFLVDSFTFNG